VLPAYVGPSGLDSALQPLVARNKIAWANPVGNANTLQVMGITLAATGTATAANVATTNIHTAMRRLEYAVTTAATGAVAGFRTTTLQYHRGAAATPYGGFFAVCRFGRSRGAAANGTLRGWCGFGSITSAPTDVDPSTTRTNAIGVCCDAADTNWHIVHRAGTATATKVDTGIPKVVADTSEMYELAAFTSPQDPDVHIVFTRLSDGVSFAVDTSANIPAETQLLAFSGYHSVGGTSSVIGISLASLYIETDY